MVYFFDRNFDKWLSMRKSNEIELLIPIIAKKKKQLKKTTFLYGFKDLDMKTKSIVL